MKRRRHTPEQIIRKLREADWLLAEGHQVPEVAKQPEVSEATYHRARAQPRPPTGGARLQGHPRTRCLTNTHRPARPGSAALRRVLPPACSPSISGWRGRIIPVRQYAHRHSRPGPPPGKWCTRSHQLITMLGLPMLPSDRLLLTWRSSRPGRARAGLAPPPDIGPGRIRWRRSPCRTTPSTVSCGGCVGAGRQRPSRRSFASLGPGPNPASRASISPRPIGPGRRGLLGPDPAAQNDRGAGCRG
jgi:hypothetical protein